MTGDLTFEAWAGAWLAIGNYTGVEVPDLESRLEQTLALWGSPIPGPTKNWRRGVDEQLHGPRFRKSLGQRSEEAPGELAIERELLEPDPSTIDWCGLPLVDGFNAVPLAQRKRGVVGDALLLVNNQGRLHLDLVEVKVSNRTVWYATLELLRQMRLAIETPDLRRVFRQRKSDPSSGDDLLPLVGTVLAPIDYFTHTGQKLAAVEPARQLIALMEKQLPSAVIKLAVWDEDGRSAFELP